MRPLPPLTPASEWFWTSGADGRLRVQGCADCKALAQRISWDQGTLLRGEG